MRTSERWLPLLLTLTPSTAGVILINVTPIMIAIAIATALISEPLGEAIVPVQGVVGTI